MMCSNSTPPDFFHVQTCSFQTKLILIQVTSLEAIYRISCFSLAETQKPLYNFFFMCAVVLLIPYKEIDV